MAGVRPGEAFLDVACGTGRTLCEAENSFIGSMLCGIDFSQVALQGARKRLSGAYLICVNVDLGLPFRNSVFDKVMCLGSLEHFRRQSFVVQELRRVLRPGGKALFLVPNHDYILHRLGYETDQQPVIKRYNLEGWLELLTQNGLHAVSVEKENNHSQNLGASSSYVKHFLKLLIHPFVGLLPIRWSSNFVIVCANGKG